MKNHGFGHKAVHKIKIKRPASGGDTIPYQIQTLSRITRKAWARESHVRGESNALEGDPPTRRSRSPPSAVPLFGVLDYHFGWYLYSLRKIEATNKSGPSPKPGSDDSGGYV